VSKARARLQAEYAIKALEQNDPELLGACLFDQWNLKLHAQPTQFHASMERVIQGALKNGAYGGKLIGAGNGGFLLFAGKVDPLLMRRQGLVEVPFKFEYDGSVIL
jgi:D-glycero-alpha-D-manno-heptose-7-phosphate kinase